MPGVWGFHNLGPLGGSITHFNFDSRNPGDAMADESWDKFINGLKAKANFHHVIAKLVSFRQACMNWIG